MTTPGGTFNDRGEVKLLAIYACVIMLYLVPAANAQTVPVPPGWHAPRAWLLGAVCIHNHEGAWNDNTGNTYFGGLQFLPGTWERAGGPDEVAFHHPGDPRYPFTPTPREQLFYAYRLWDKDRGTLGDGLGTWSEWGTRWKCGLQ